MAAVNASPTYRGRVTGQAQRNSQQQVPPPSQAGVRGAYHVTSSRTGHHINGTDVRSNRHNPYQQHAVYSESTDIQDISDDQMYLPDAGKYKGDTNGHRVMNDSSSAVLVARSLPSSETLSGQDFEIQHLRTQVKSVGVLQELLAEARSETHGLQEVVEAQAAVLNQHGLEVGAHVQEKLSRLRLGSSYSVPDSEWSVELKRPPYTTQNLQTDGPDQVPESTRLLHKKDEEIRALKEEIKSLKDEITNLHHLLQSSEDKKEQEIGRLMMHLDASSRDCQTSEAICRSLNGETEALKTRIQLLVQECQGLTKELSNWKRKKLPERTPPSAMSDTPVSVEDQLQVTKRQVQQLDREKGQLGGQLKEVIRMNKKWQKYNHQQDKLKQELTETKIDLENQNKVYERQCKDYEDSIANLQCQLQDIETQRRHHRVDNTLVAGKEDIIRRQERRIVDLEQELRKACRDNSKYDREMVKQQLKQYTEDFQKEHTEKEKLKRENTILIRNQLEADELLKELSRKLDIMEKENRDLKQGEFRRNAGYMYPAGNEPRRQRRELIPHGFAQNGSVVSLGEFPTLPQDVQPDGPNNLQPNSPINIQPNVSPPFSSASPPISPPPMTAETRAGEDVVDGKVSPSPCREDDPLQCPRCLREFPVSKHTDFMRHTVSCLDT